MTVRTFTRTKNIHVYSLRPRTCTPVNDTSIFVALFFFSGQKSEPSHEHDQTPVTFVKSPWELDRKQSVIFFTLLYLFFQLLIGSLIRYYY